MPLSPVDWPACTFVQSEQALSTLIFHLDIPKMIMDSTKMKGGVFQLRNSAG